MKRIVVILGNYEGTRHLFDWARKDCDIWVLNEMASNTNPAERWIQRADAVFQLHAEPIWRNPLNRTDPGHYEWLRTQTELPVYMQKHYDDVPMSVEYPLDEIRTFLLSNFNIKNVFSSTLSYCMALAIHKGYEKIETYGVEMGTETEYFHQREGFTFWLGQAVGRGIRVEVHTDQLLHAPLYGYEGEVTLPYETFTKRIEQLTPHVAEMEQAYIDRRADTAKALISLKRELSNETIQAAVNAINAQLVAAVDYAVQDGGKQENERYIHKADTMKAATGSFIFSRQEFESAKNSLRESHAGQALRANQLAERCDLMIKTVIRRRNKQARSRSIDQLAAVIEDYMREVVNTGMLSGAIAENHAYLKRLDAGIRAAGGQRSADVLIQQAVTA